VVATPAAVRAGLRGAALVRGLVDLLGPSKVLGARADLVVYEYDGAVDTATPDAVVLPESTADVSALARFCHEHAVPIVPRGAGTGLSGGAIPVEGGVVVSFARMARIVEIDAANRWSIVWVASAHTGFTWKGGTLLGPADAVRVVCFQDSSTLHSYPTKTTDLKVATCADCGRLVP